MIELRLLGVLDLRREGAEPFTAILSQPKRLALLAYLALAPEQSFRRRDSIAALLWPEQDQEHSRGSLRQALRFLRRELGDELIRNRGEEEIGLDSSLIRCDVVAFKRAIAAGRPEEAARLYQGGLLPGFFVAEAAPEFDQWLDAERSRMRGLAADALWAATEGHRQQDAFAEAITTARRAVRLSPDDETGVRRLLRLLDEAGDRAGAMAAYEEFEARLKKEYQGAPSVETQKLIGSIRSRVLPPGQAAPKPAVAGAVGGDAAPVAAPTLPPQPRRFALPALISAAVVVVAAFFVMRALQTPKGISPTATVAVLPIQDLTGDTTEATVAEAATDELITDLAQIGSLRVINRRTMMLYRGSKEPLDSIARMLGAGMVVTSTIERRGEDAELRVQLVAAGDPGAVWARNFSGIRGELPGWLQDVTQAVAEYARIELTGSEQAALAARRRVDPAAFELYTKGRWWWNRRGQANLQKALDFFEKALEVDPSYAQAWSGRADAFAQMGYGGYLPPEEAFTKAKAAARRALDFDSTLGEPHAALGFSMMYFDWDWAGAEREFRRAVARTFSYATAHEWYGLFLAAMGRFPEAESEGRIAQELDPLSAAAMGTRGWILHSAEKETEALRVLRAGARTDPKNGVVQLYLGRVHETLGQFDSATAHYLSTGPLHSWIPTVASEGTVAARAGRPAEARQVIRYLDSLGRAGEYVTPYAVALVYAALGEKDSAFARLGQGLRQRTHWLVWLHRDSRWQPLRTDPRFAGLVRQVGLPK